MVQQNTDIIPVSIEGQYYSRTEFIARINEQYITSHQKGKHQLGHPITTFTLRNKTSTGMQWLLNTFYQPERAQKVNGLKHWDEIFYKHFENEESITAANEYLNFVLTKKLNHFLVKNKRPTVQRCRSYPEYIYRCIEQNYIPAVDIRWRDDRGWSLFAQEDIPAFTFLGFYCGEIGITLYHYFINIFRRSMNYYRWILYGNEHFLIDCETCGSHTRFINNDIAQSNRAKTFSVELYEDGSPFCLPHNGLIATEGKVKKNLAFAQDEEIIWYYGDNYSTTDMN